MMKLKKRGAVYGIIAVMLGVAVYLNWSYVSTPEDLLVAGQVSSSGQKDKEEQEDRKSVGRERVSWYV